MLTTFMFCCLIPLAIESNGLFKGTKICSQNSGTRAGVGAAAILVAVENSNNNIINNVNCKYNNNKNNKNSTSSDD